jgi:hypothetical protein
VQAREVDTEIDGVYQSARVLRAELRVMRRHLPPRLVADG